MSDFSSALIGASAAILVGFGLEQLKRYREMRSISAAIEGEIQALINNERRRSLINNLRLIEEAVRLHDAPARGMESSIPLTNLIFDKVADKIGVLPPEVSAKVSEFYVRLLGFRLGASDLLRGVYDKPPFTQQQRLICVQLLLNELEEGMLLARDLVRDLRETRARPFLAWS